MKKWKVLSTRKISSEKDVIEELLKIRNLTKSELKSSEKDLTIYKAEISKTEIEKSKCRIENAIKNNEKIVILGDYDVDGICAAAILWETIFSVHKNVFPYIPDRFSEGYGLSIASLDKILEKYPDVKLIITVDNGISANEAILYANKKKIDVIVTDHHVKGDKNPLSYAEVHTTNICGASVAWFLAKELNFLKEKEIKEKLELAGLATVTDLVPLTGLNRTILQIGIKLLNETNRPGLIEIFKNAGIKKGNIGVYEMGHIIGPRINAAGRVNHGMESLRLICSRDLNYVKNEALILENTNRLRQQMVTDALTHAKMNFLTNNLSDKFIAIHDKNYPEGVIGLIASRLTDAFHKPSIVISQKEEISKGSARSINGINIIDVLKKLSDLFINVGGHPMAAGFSIETSKINALYEKLCSEFKAFPEEIFDKEINIDLKIPIEKINKKLYTSLNVLAPYGMGNPEPVFLAEGLELAGFRKMGSSNSHLKIHLRSIDKIIEAVGFGMGDCELEGVEKIDAVFNLNINSWQGKESIQLKLKDIKY